MTLKILQNFYKAIVTDTWESGTGNRYVSVLPTPSAGRLVVNPSNVNKREIVEYSGTGTDGGGNYVTLITRGIGGTTDQDHDINEPVRMNVTAEDFSDVQTELDDLQDEIDTLVLQNAPNADTTTKGISKLNVAPASATEPIALGANDPRLTDLPDNFVDESSGASDSGKGVKLNEEGALDITFSPVEFGDGSDGDVTISSPTTLTRDMYYDNLTVNDTLTTDGYKIFVKNTIDGTGTIDWGTPNNGSNGANSDLTGPAGGAQSGSGLLKNTAGQNGGAVQNPGAGLQSAGSTSGYFNVSGSAGGAGGAVADGNPSSVAGRVGGTDISLDKFGVARFQAVNVMHINSDATLSIRNIPGSAGGSGGSADDTGGSDRAGSGGGAGASGGIVFICANNWEGTFTIKAIGGNGGNGGAGGTFDGGAGGGGGAGAGGVSIVLYRRKSWAGSYNLIGGSGGTGGVATGGGQNGTNGEDGATGVSYEIPIGQLL